MSDNSKRTAIYCRVASSHPDDRGKIIAQERRLLDYAAEHGHTEPTVYRDCGEIGLTLNRPAMNALTADIKAGTIGTVITAGRSRIARNYALVSEWLDILSEYGATLVIPANGEYKSDTELTYTRRGDYLFPNIALSDPPDAPPLGHYGMRHKAYLREHKPALYSQLLLTERLYPLCREIDKAAATRLAAIGDTEIAREVILAELVYN